MRETFGLPYTQHETYYVVDTTPGALDLPRPAQGDVDLDAFRVEARARPRTPGSSSILRQYLQTHPAVRHRLYRIPCRHPARERSGQRRTGDQCDSLSLHAPLQPPAPLATSRASCGRCTFATRVWESRSALARARPSVRRAHPGAEAPCAVGPDWVELELGQETPTCSSPCTGSTSRTSRLMVYRGALSRACPTSSRGGDRDRVVKGGVVHDSRVREDDLIAACGGVATAYGAFEEDREGSSRRFVP